LEHTEAAALKGRGFFINRRLTPMDADKKLGYTGVYLRQSACIGGKK